MMKRNTSLHTIRLCADERDQQIYAEMILPYLETNRYIPRVLAITKAAIHSAAQTFAGSGAANQVCSEHLQLRMDVPVGESGYCGLIKRRC
jgi:hypothetical protein